MKVEDILFEQLNDDQLDLTQEPDIKLSDYHEIQHLLALLPKLIHLCEEKVQQAEARMDIAKEHLDVEKAKAHLRAVSNDDH